MGWKQEAAAKVKEAGEGNSISFDQGENTLRILPHKDRKKAPYKVFPQHNLGPEDKKRRVACGKDRKGSGDCWACDKKIPELSESASESKRKLAVSMAKKDCLLLQASKVTPDTGKFSKPKRWWLNLTGRKSQGVKILSLLSSSKHSYEDPIKGRNITITRVGTGLNTEYPSILPDDESSKVPSAILNLIEPLEEFVPQYSEQAQKDAYLGRESKDTVKSQPKGKPKKKHEEEEVEEEDEDEVEEDEVEEEDDEEESEEESEDQSEDEESEEEDEDESEDGDESEDEDESEDDDEESEDDEEYDSDEDEPSDDEDESEEDAEEEDEEEAPRRSAKKVPAKKVKAPKKKKTKVPPPPPPKKKLPLKKGKRK